MPYAAEPRLGHAARTLWREVVGGLLVRPPSGAVIRLTGSGPAVWRALETPTSVESLVTQLAGEYDFDADAVREDVTPVLEQLVERGALRWT